MTCRLPLKCLWKHGLRPLYWLLSTLISHFSWKLILASQDWGGVIAEAVWWAVLPCCICEPVPDQLWAYLSFYQMGVFGLEVAIMEQFQEYLCWKPFVVKTNNNPLTYILTTPNLDATQHHWVRLLTGFTFSIEHQKGRDNAVVDALSHVMSKLNAEGVKSILDGVTIGTTGRANAHDPMVAAADERIHTQLEETAVQAQAAHMHVNLHVTDWVVVQQEDPILKIVMEWISSHKVQDLKHLLGDHTTSEESMAILRERGRNSHSIRVPFVTAILQPES